MLSVKSQFQNNVSMILGFLVADGVTVKIYLLHFYKST